MGTPQPTAALSGCKTPPFPVPLLSLPSPRGRREGSPQAKSLRQVRNSGGGGPGPPPPVTCEDSDTDLMIVVSEDHSLGRHVSQRSHRTDRSREKPELGTRRPGARSPWPAARAGARGERGRRGRRPSACRPAPGRGRAGSARVRGRGRSQGARPRVPVGGGELRVAHAEAKARRCPSRPVSPWRLCRARGPGRLESERLREKESTRSGGCGGGRGDGAELHGEA